MLNYNNLLTNLQSYFTVLVMINYYHCRFFLLKLSYPRHFYWYCFIASKISIKITIEPSIVRTTYCWKTIIQQMMVTNLKNNSCLLYDFEEKHEFEVKVMVITTQIIVCFRNI